MKVIGWIDYDEAEDFEESFGGMGGFFNDGMRWKDYIEGWSEEVRQYPEAIRAEVIENKIRITGDNHQHGAEGVPVFADGTLATFSYRAWGDMMAAIWSEKEGRDYCYMDFYM